MKAPRKTRFVSGYRKVRNVLAAILLVVGILIVVAPPVRGVFKDTVGQPIGKLWDRATRWYTNLTDDYIEVPPVSAVAAPPVAAVKGHPAENVIDGTDSFWAAPFSKRKHPGVLLAFGKENASNFYDVAFVTGGASGDDKDKFLHPKVVRFTYGSSNSETCELAEPSGEAQRCDLEQAATFRRVTVSVISVFEKEGLGEVAIQDIQLKRKKD